MPQRVKAGGESRPVHRDEPIPGTDSPVFQLFTDPARTQTYGYFRSNRCETDVSVDGLDRIECVNCGNTHLADEWDAVYLSASLAKEDVTWSCRYVPTDVVRGYRRWQYVREGRYVHDSTAMGCLPAAACVSRRRRRLVASPTA